jgi:phenylalanyl-tRNA synthetase alpha chain
MQKIESIQTEFEADIKQVISSADIESLRVKYLGKKGSVQELMQFLKHVSSNEKPHVGKLINDLKTVISQKLDVKLEELRAVEDKDRLLEETCDVALPGRRSFSGKKHILTATLDFMVDILIGMGFSVQYGPDIDTDYYNFEVLNFPEDHPARDMQDTFYITKDILLRTHTSNIQARVMESNSPPIRIVAPGTAFRNESITARSHVFFHQVETLYVDRNVSFADLLATMNEFLMKMFDHKVEIRFRPSYFPFVEPGMEVDVNCLSCRGQGCHICKHTGWLEVAGAGMVHPEVLKNSGIDSEIFNGFAWGMGVERIAMLIHGIKDIRLFTENNLRFLSQFPAV